MRRRIGTGLNGQVRRKGAEAAAAMSLTKQGCGTDRQARKLHIVHIAFIEIPNTDDQAGEVLMEPRTAGRSEIGIIHVKDRVIGRDRETLSKSGRGSIEIQNHSMLPRVERVGGESECCMYLVISIH